MRLTTNERERERENWMNYIEEEEEEEEEAAAHPFTYLSSYLS